MRSVQCATWCLLLHNVVLGPKRAAVHKEVLQILGVQPKRIAAGVLRGRPARQSKYLFDKGMGHKGVCERLVMCVGSVRGKTVCEKVCVTNVRETNFSVRNVWGWVCVCVCVCVCVTNVHVFL